MHHLRMKGGGSSSRWDFFISYTAADRRWAEWIAWTLEEAGLRVLVQAWDFIPGSNWVRRMQEGVAQADRTIAVLSRDYLRSVYGQLEWQAALAADPLGFASKLVPVRIADCERPGLLGQIVSFDLFGLSEEAAASRLCEQVEILRAGRAKPPSPPDFPGGSSRADAEQTPVTVPVETSLPPVPAVASQSGVLVRRAALYHGTRLARMRRQAEVAALGWSPTGHRLATGGGDGTVGVWDMRDSAAPVHRITLPEQNGAVWALSWSPDGRRLAVGRDDARVSIWTIGNRENPSCEKVLSDYNSAVWALAWSPDGRWLATGSDEGTARMGDAATAVVWDMTNPATPDHRRVLTDHNGGVRAVGWSPDGRWLATGTDDATVVVWDMTDPATPTRRSTLTSYNGWVLAIGWSPDGRWLTTGSEDATVLVWDMSDTAAPARRATLTDHRDWVRATSWSPDRRWLATGSGDGTVGVWDMADPAAPRRQATLTDHSGGIRAVSWSPDNRWLATAGRDGTALIWERR